MLYVEILKNQLPVIIKKVWRQVIFIEMAIFFVLTIAYLKLAYLFDWSYYWGSIGLVILLLLYFVEDKVINSLRWHRFRFEIREEELEIAYGIIFRHRELIPMVRIQHVETTQGPLLRKAGLMTVDIHTAATVHTILGLEENQAEQLRNQIIALVKVAVEDV